MFSRRVALAEVEQPAEPLPPAHATTRTWRRSWCSRDQASTEALMVPLGVVVVPQK